jgi:C4-dicarboxylate transporter, DctM subunit
VFIVNMEIGYLAPPIATNLFVAASIFKRPFGLVTRAVLPTLAILCLGLLVVTYVPTLTVGPVHALRGGSFWRPFARAPEAEAPAGPGGPAPGANPAAAPVPGKVLTIEEMMRAARARRAAAGAGSPADAGAR